MKDLYASSQTFTDCRHIQFVGADGAVRIIHSQYKAECAPTETDDVCEFRFSKGIGKELIECRHTILGKVFTSHVTIAKLKNDINITEFVPDSPGTYSFETVIPQTFLSKT